MPCLKPPKREGECAPSVRKGRCWVALHWAGTARAASPLDGDARTCTTEPEETKHPILQRRRLVAERSSVRGWQDLRAVRDSRGPCSESGPFMARSSRGVSPNGCLQGFSDAWRAYPAKASSFRMHGARILPRIAARGRISRAFFHRQAHGNAPWQNLATNRHSGTHRTSILPLPVRPRTHQGAILPPSDAGNAFREHFAIVERPGNAYPQCLANRTASSCGQAYCLALALVPHESDGLFVQAVLCA